MPVAPEQARHDEAMLATRRGLLQSRCEQLAHVQIAPLDEDRPAVDFRRWLKEIYIACSSAGPDFLTAARLTAEAANAVPRVAAATNALDNDFFGEATP